VVKCAALETLAELADRAGKRDATILALMRFLKNPNEELVVAAMHGLGRLKAEFAAETLSQFAADSNLELSAEAIRTLGLIGKSSSLPLILEQIKSEHAVHRTAAYEACLHYETLPGGPWTTSVPRVSSPGEALALGVFLLFHGEEGRSREILLDQYKIAEDRMVRIRLLETLALFHSGITTLDLLKLVRKQDLESWEKSKTIMERCPLRLATPAIVDGFLFYLGRQPRNVQYTMMSFTSASESIWDQQDVLYLKGKGENRGRIQGVILHENYNSYYYAVTEKEVLQVSRRLVAATHYSPLYELFVFQCEQRRFYELFETALEREKWKAAGYVLQKVLVRWTVLNAEILHHPVALRALETIEKKWKGQAKRFRTRLEEEGVVQVADRYVSLQEAAAEQLEKLDPEEARRRRERAEERYREGVDLAERGDYRQAVSRFREALEIWPFHGAALREIGVSFARLGEYEKALDFYERLKKKRKPDPDLQNSISLIYRLMDKPRKALNALTREIELDPSLARGRLDAADVLMELERTEQALELLESGLPLVENPFDLHFKLARIYRKSKENENAIRHMEKALSLKPEDVDALTYMGLLRFAAGDTPRAINALKKAIAFDMANIPARLTLSEIYIGIGDWKAARVELEKILAIDPRNAEARQLIESIDQER
jgi:tetratricopeptide (TPR) repeat protein